MGEAQVKQVAKEAYVAGFMARNNDVDSWSEKSKDQAEAEFEQWWAMQK